MKRIAFLLVSIAFSYCTYAQEPADTPVATECCSGENLIENGDFTNGMPVITSSDYTERPVNTNTFLAGQYSRRKPTGPSTRTFMACVEWDIQDQDYCGNYDAGAYLLVNGLTCDNGWQNVMTMRHVLDPGTYNFCVDFKNLRNSCINFMQPQIEIEVIDVSTATQLATKTFFLTNNTNDPCDWRNEFMNFVVNAQGAVDIRISHNADFRIDGNDFAIDNLSLKSIPQISASDLEFEVSTTSVSRGYTVTVNPVNPLPSEGCDEVWTLEESVAGGAYVVVSTILGAGPHNFGGYVLDYENEYRIKRSVSCPCATSNSWSFGFQYGGKIGFSDISITSLNDPNLVYTSIEQLEGSEYDNLYQIYQSRKNAKKGENVINEKLAVYPNPTSGVFSIEATQLESGDYSIEVYTMDGRLIHTQSGVVVENGVLSEEVTITNAPAGALKVVLTGADEVSSTTVVISKE